MEFITTNINFLLVAGGAVLIISILSLMIGPKVIGSKFGAATIAGVLAIIGIGVSLPYLVQIANLPTRTSTLAQTNIQPKNIQILSVQPTEFTITWQTESPVIGAIRFGTSPENLDLAAAEFDPSTHKTNHEVLATGLLQGNTYHIEIISGGKVFQLDTRLQITLPL